MDLSQQQSPLHSDQMAPLFDDIDQSNRPLSQLPIQPQLQSNNSLTLQFNDLDQLKQTAKFVNVQNYSPPDNEATEQPGSVPLKIQESVSADDEIPPHRSTYRQPIAQTSDKEIVKAQQSHVQSCKFPSQQLNYNTTKIIGKKNNIKNDLDYETRSLRPQPVGQGLSTARSEKSYQAQAVRHLSPFKVTKQQILQQNKQGLRQLNSRGIKQTLEAVEKGLDHQISTKDHQVQTEKEKEKEKENQYEDQGKQIYKDNLDDKQTKSLFNQVAQTTRFMPPRTQFATQTQKTDQYQFRSTTRYSNTKQIQKSNEKSTVWPKQKFKQNKQSQADQSCDQLKQNKQTQQDLSVQVVKKNFHIYNVLHIALSNPHKRQTSALKNNLPIIRKDVIAKQIIDSSPVGSQFFNTRTNNMNKIQFAKEFNKPAASELNLKNTENKRQRLPSQPREKESNFTIRRLRNFSQVNNVAQSSLKTLEEQRIKFAQFIDSKRRVDKIRSNKLQSIRSQQVSRVNSEVQPFQFDSPIRRSKHEKVAVSGKQAMLRSLKMQQSGISLESPQVRQVKISDFHRIEQTSQKLQTEGIDQNQKPTLPDLPQFPRAPRIKSTQDELKQLSIEVYEYIYYKSVRSQAQIWHEAHSVQELRGPASSILLADSIWEGGETETNKATVYKFCLKVDSQLVYVYEGHFSDGKKHGYGTLWQSDYVYRGEWRQGQKQGKGKQWQGGVLVSTVYRSGLREYPRS